MTPIALKVLSEPDQLPDKLSDLIMVAVADMEKVNKDSGSVLNMMDWYMRSRVDKICHVCCAGAVMMHTLKVPKPYPGKNVDIMEAAADINPRTYAKLQALNNVRAGRVVIALHDLKEARIVTTSQIEKYKRSRLHRKQWEVSYYTKHDWISFRENLIFMSNELRSIGL